MPARSKRSPARAMLGPARPDRSSSPRQIAGAGLRGTGAPLPHLERIQKSFGAHDLSGVRSFTGRGPLKSCRAFNARAYTFGEKVGFSNSPDLHTAAHEAAHIVQQRRGVSLRDGIGRANDRYERQADEAADRVVRGESVGPVLGDAGSEPARSTAGAGVQLAQMSPGSDGYKGATRAAKLFQDFTNETTNMNVEVQQYKNDLQTNPGNKITYTEEKGLGFEQWAISATTASQRYYAEWKAAQAAVGVNEVKFGVSDKTDPDVEINLKAPSRKRALEVKSVDSASVGNVDEHTATAQEQLAKRKKSTLGNKDFDEHHAQIYIQSSNNPWPFTATSKKKLKNQNPSVARLQKKALKRLTVRKYPVPAKGTPTNLPIVYEFTLGPAAQGNWGGAVTSFQLTH